MRGGVVQLQITPPLLLNYNNCCVTIILKMGGCMENEHKTISQCELLLQSAVLPDKVKEHCRAVAEVSVKIAQALNKKGWCIDTGLCLRAGLLHDICRTESEHDEKGWAYLKELGFVEEAEIIKTHMGRELKFIENSSIISEHEVVYIADKLITGSKRCTLEQRFESALIKYGNDTETAKEINEKYALALAVSKKIEDIIGLKLGDV
jgi:molybdenum cofactor cytidylyltransferase